MKYYTGIGSRETPQEVIEKMVEIGHTLGLGDWTLRSGGADGADSAFEKGCDLVDGTKQIFLPWKNFNGRTSQYTKAPKEAFELASTIHPVWESLSYGAKCLHARNCQQVLGPDLSTPSNLLICWTLGGGERGGTATAIKLAKLHNVPVFNLYDTAFNLEDWINES